MPYILLIIGFIMIIKASDVLIDASKSIAIKYKVPKILIALTIVAFGTCAPELAISFTSVIGQNGSMALANVIGSSIVNILLIIGVSTIFHPISVKNKMIKKELPILVVITFCFVLVMGNALLDKNKQGILTSFDGLILILLFSIFVIYILRTARRKIISFNNEKAKYGIVKAVIYLTISLVVISVSANLLIDNAIIIAKSFGLSEKIITMSAIVIGTSLPELFLTITSARKKESEIAIGNIIGTNIFNICIVLGLPVFLFNGFKIIDFNMIDLLVVLVASVLLFIFARSEKKLSRKEGFIMLFIFCLYYLYIFINN